LDELDELDELDVIMLFDFLIRPVYTEEKEDLKAELLRGKERTMAGKRKVLLEEHQYTELVNTRDHAALPYQRERAAAILKVAEGLSVRKVAASGLLKRVRRETVSEWIDRYEQEGLAGLKIRDGRGKKPAFSPCS
jgi:Helix-turn-helix domain